MGWLGLLVQDGGGGGDGGGGDGSGGGAEDLVGGLGGK